MSLPKVERVLITLLQEHYIQDKYLVL